MIIVIKPQTSIQEIQTIEGILHDKGVRFGACYQEDRWVLGLDDPGAIDKIKEIRERDSIETMTPISSQHPLVSREGHPKTTTIEKNGVMIGEKKIVLMAGPCAIESMEQLQTVACDLKKAGVSVLRASAYKPRTSPYSFQGLGDMGVKMHAEAQREHGLLIETEVMDVRDVAFVAEHVDIIRVGARNMQNFDLLKELGWSQKIIILKRGIAATIEEWLLSAEYLMAYGNSQVILCERGIRTFETATRSTLDLSSVPVVKELTHLPVIVDPSHAAGQKKYIFALAKAAIAVGADGLLIEVHPDPTQSITDAKQALSPKEFSEMIPHLRKVAQAIGRDL